MDQEIITSESQNKCLKILKISVGKAILCRNLLKLTHNIIY